MSNLFSPPKFAKGEFKLEPNTFNLVGYFGEVARKSFWNEREISQVGISVLRSSAEKGLEIIKAHLDPNLDLSSKGTMFSILDEDAVQILNELNLLDANLNDSLEQGHSKTEHGEVVRATLCLHNEYNEKKVFFFDETKNQKHGAKAVNYLIKTIGGDVAAMVQNYMKEPSFAESDYERLLKNIIKQVCNHLRTQENIPNTANFNEAGTQEYWNYYKCSECGSAVLSISDCCEEGF